MHDTQPKWMLVGGCWLAFLAAAQNASFMIQLGTSVSHLTGDLSRFAVNVATPAGSSAGDVFLLLAALGGFLTGAILAGVILHRTQFEITQPYGRSIMAIGALLVVSGGCLEPWPTGSVLFAAVGCGMQNALATHYRGIILRTTHITGLLTDIGLGIGLKLRGRPLARWKILVPTSLVTCFFFGATAGAALTFYLGPPTVLVLGIAYALGGVCWTIYKHWIFLPRRAAARDADADPLGNDPR